MKHKPWIGLIGKAGAGKDTVAAILNEFYGYRRIAFADPVREMLLRLDPVIHDPLNKPLRLSLIVGNIGWEEAKRSIPEVRLLLQRLGTDCVRAVTPNYWVEQAEQSALDTPDPVVFTDLRFINEADMVRHWGGVIVEVIREEHHLDAHADGHISEQEWRVIAPDAVIFNTADEHTLRLHVADVWHNMIKEGARV